MKLVGMLLFLIFIKSAVSQSDLKEIKIRDDEYFVLTSANRLSINVKTKQGMTYFWYADQRIRSNDGGYHGQLLQGDYKKFDSDNNLIESGCFNKGRKKGQWIIWNNKGKIECTSEWRKGRPHGNWCYYDGTSKPTMEKKYKNGILIKELDFDELENQKSKKNILCRFFGIRKMEVIGGEEAP